MSERRRTSDAIIVAGVVLCLVLVALGSYAGAYLYLGTRYPDPDVDAVMIGFDGEWQLTFFKPAEKVESLLTGRVVITGVNEP